MQDLDSSNTSGQSDRVHEILEGAARIVASAELEFESKGYSPGLARAAVARARAAAQYRVEAIASPLTRAEAFIDTFKAELRDAEGWIEREQAGLTRQEGG